MDQRKVGRPPKGEAEVGKSGLIQKARDELRVKRYDIFQRKNLARACGVTPALITYYFKSPDEIFQLIISAVIEEHYIEIRNLARSTSLDPNKKYSLVVERLIDVFRRDRNLFDVFEYAVAMKPAEVQDYIALMKQEVRLLCEDGITLGIPKSFEQSLFHEAVWGMCEAAAKYPVEDEFSNEALSKSPISDSSSEAKA